ncbi:hypothetical protein THAOC_04840 [Thalassiosira oceanica]|uniref:Uncharacterized protein n=1 Tax=Thalassiosira oceanica TaxID=159749 RepID=K0T7A6_THAOC|nr:hypothetical protein THAOC_04840 [Thalassiosira oceanica]|eukprot:EJK73530.1 hypothetical protein THAOC_04840 [Thalassiosira oceanica]
MVPIGLPYPVAPSKALGPCITKRASERLPGPNFSDGSLRQKCPLPTQNAARIASCGPNSTMVFKNRTRKSSFLGILPSRTTSHSRSTNSGRRGARYVSLAKEKRYEVATSMSLELATPDAVSSRRRIRDSHGSRSRHSRGWVHLGGPQKLPVERDDVVNSIVRCDMLEVFEMKRRAKHLGPIFAAFRYSDRHRHS